jgi:hypothetical protein
MPTPRKHSDRAHRQRAYRERQKSARITEIRAKGLPPTAQIPTMPSTARWKAIIQMASGLLSTARQEMETYWEDRSDTWQESDKGEAFQENIDRIAEALDTLDDIE